MRQERGVFQTEQYYFPKSDDGKSLTIATSRGGKLKDRKGNFFETDIGMLFLEEMRNQLRCKIAFMKKNVVIQMI